MEKINLEKQKEIQLEILKEIKNFCNNNNLRYFLSGGTLLGAIRHKGYIPWDDDIDIMMPREDYDKLLANFNEKCNDQLKVLSFINTDGYYYPFAKVVNIKTVLIEDNYREIKDLGIYVDIFPIDYLPDNEKETKKIMQKYKKLNKLIGIYSVDVDKMTTNKLKLIIKKLILLLIEKGNNYKKILKKIDNIASEYKNTEKVACISGRYFESSYIEKSILVDFENEQYTIPVGYEEYLTKHYGDYMQLPPEEKRVKQHENQVYWR